MNTREKILARFGGDGEAMRAYYRALQKKSRETYNGTGGFQKGSELARLAGAKGGRASRRGKGTNEEQKPAE